MPIVEREALREGRSVIGVDEVGRGAWAGPLAVGAVLRSGSHDAPAGLDDSKRLSASRREALVEPLRQWAGAVSIGWASAAEIDQWGVRVALGVAARRALSDLLPLAGTHPLVLVDGPLDLLHPPLPLAIDPPAGWGLVVPAAEPIVGGDHASPSIAAASVLAKVERDAWMCRRDEDIPGYEWSRNKGYGTGGHRRALDRLGPSVEHRRSWKPFANTGPGDRGGPAD